MFVTLWGVGLKRGAEVSLTADAREKVSGRTPFVVHLHLPTRVSDDHVCICCCTEPVTWETRVKTGETTSVEERTDSGREPAGGGQDAGLRGVSGLYGLAGLTGVSGLAGLAGLAGVGTASEIALETVRDWALGSNWSMASPALRK